MQTINLPGTCGTHSVALHEIGHAIGFWHEQSRPDRNNYVTVNWNNIAAGKKSQFEIRHYVDYQGEKYDYASVMHYGLRDSSIGTLASLSVNNGVRFRAQGSPTIGNKPHLSAGDIRLVDKLYKCYNPQGYGGRLSVKITGLPSSTIETHYAEIIAYDSKGETQRHSWNKAFITSHREGWRYFEITIKTRRESVVLRRQTIWVESRGPVSDSYCLEDKCVYFNYQIF